MFSVLNLAISSYNGKIFNIFLIKNAHLLKILVYDPIFLLVPESLELFFTPKNTPLKVKNSKMGLNQIFLGHPVDLQ